MAAPENDLTKDVDDDKTASQEGVPGGDDIKTLPVEEVEAAAGADDVQPETLPADPGADQSDEELRPVCGLYCEHGYSSEDGCTCNEAPSRSRSAARFKSILVVMFSLSV